MQETPPLIPLLMNKYVSLFEISSNSISVILDIACTNELLKKIS